MDDPFDSLSKKQAAHQDASRQKEERLKHLKPPSFLLELEQAARDYNPMVTRVLSNLRSAYFVDCEPEIRQDRYAGTVDGQECWIWSIASWSNANQRYVEKASVYLVRDLPHDKFYLLCRRQDSFRETLCEPIEFLLEQALVKLFK